MLRQKAQRVLDHLAFGNITQDIRHADNFTALILDRRAAEQDIDATAVFGDSHSLIRLDHIAGLDDRAVSKGFIEFVLRRQYVSTAIDLFNGVAEHPLRCGIPRRHLSIRCPPDNRVARVFDDCREARARLIRALALADVAQDIRHADDFAVVVADRRSAEGKIDPPAVLRHAHGLIGRSQQSGTPNHFGIGITKHAFRRRIPRGHLAFEIAPDDRIVGVFNNCGQSRAARFGMPFVARLGQN